MLDDFHKCVRDWVLNKPFSYNSDRVSVIQSNFVFFNPRGWWNPPMTFYKIWLYRVFSRVELGVLHECVWDLILKKAYCYNPDQMLVTRAIFWPWPFTGSSLLAVNMVFCNPRSETLLVFLKFLAVPSLVLCVLPCPVRVGWFAQSCLVFTLKTYILYNSYLLFVISWIFWPLGFPSFPLPWYF